MGFFEKILVQTDKGDIIDVTELTQLQYESFLRGMVQLNDLYYKKLTVDNMEFILEKYESKNNKIQD